MANTTTMETRIAEILGTENNNGWVIEDSLPDSGLYLVHYKDTANMVEYGHLRGVVVDVNAGVVVCSSFGYTPVATASEIKPNMAGDIVMVDEQGFRHTFTKGKYDIKIGFEGVVIRVFWHNGKMYRTTHKRLNPSRSRWGNSKPFLTMYDDLGGPTADQLFDTSKDYSPWCHVFIVIDQKLLVGSKQDVGPGYIAYLGSNQMWSTSAPPEAYRSIDAELHKPATQSDIPPVITEPFIYEPGSLDLASAKFHLASGYYEPQSATDERLTSGEFVILYSYGDDGKVQSLLRVHSPAYSWRLQMRDSDPNLRHRFYELINGSYMPTDSEVGLREFIERFPLMPLYSVEDVQTHFEQEGPFINISSEGVDVNDLNSKISRLHMIWLDFLVSVPPQQQKIVLDMFTDLVKERKDVINWLQELSRNENINDNEDVIDRAKGIIAQAGKYASERGRNGNNRTRQGKIMTYWQLVDANIANLVMKERGASLYKLVRNYKNILKQRETESSSE